MRWITVVLILLLTSCFPRQAAPAPTSAWDGQLKVVVWNFPIPLNVSLECKSFDSELSINSTCFASALGRRETKPYLLNGVRNGDNIEFTLVTPDNPNDTVLIRGKLAGNKFSGNGKLVQQFQDRTLETRYELNLTLTRLNAAGFPEDRSYDATGRWNVEIPFSEGGATVAIAGDCDIRDAFGALAGSCDLAVGGERGVLRLSGRRTGNEAYFFIINTVNELLSGKNRRIYAKGSFQQGRFRGEANLYSEGSLKGSITMSK